MVGKKGQAKGIISKQCSRCERSRDNLNKRYCNKCHADYMREYRKKVPLNEEQIFKNNVRRKTNMRIKRGLLIKQPCEICGSKNVEAHHDDYKKAYEIKWFCRKHHLEHHKNSRMNI